MRKYIFHTDFQYSASKDCYLVWLEIFDEEKNINKFGTKEDIYELFFKNSIPTYDTMSRDFYIPHYNNIRLLDSYDEELYPDVNEKFNDLTFLKKYVDCALVPFYDYTYFVKQVKLMQNTDYSISKSFKFYTKFNLFVRKLIEKKYFIPGFYRDDEDDYEFSYYPYFTRQIKEMLKIFVDNIPMISILDNGRIEDRVEFINNLLRSQMNSIIQFLLTKGDASEYVDRILRSSNLAHLVIKNDNVKICDYNFDEWKNWVSTITSNYKFVLNFSNTGDQCWRINYGLLNDDSVISAKDIYEGDEKLKRFFVSELIRASQFTQYIKDSLLSPKPEYVDLTEQELLKFLKYDSIDLKENRIVILYPKFYKGIKKLSAKVTFQRRTLSSLSKGIMSNLILDFRWKLFAGKKEIEKQRIEELLSQNREFVKIDDEYIELDLQSLKRIIKELKNEEERFENGISFFEALNYDISDDFEVDKTHLLESIMNKESSDTVFKIDSNIEGFNGKLRKYQEDGVSFIKFLDNMGLGVILADDMGLGKTIQIIALLLLKNPQKPVLIVTPTTLLYNWELEIKKFSPSLKPYLHYGVNRRKDINNIIKDYNIILCSYGVIKRDLDVFLKYSFDSIIIDEAQYIKNPLSDQAKAVKKLVGDNRFALTGTPIENRLMELWSIMDFVNPGLLLDSNNFMTKYEIPIMKNDDEIKKKQLYGVISPFVLRRMKTDKNIIQDLPEKQETKIYLPLTDEQILLYDQEIKNVEKEFTTGSKLKSKMNMLAVITRLKQICNHPVNYLKDNSNDLFGRSSKLDSLRQMIKTIDQEERKTLVFTQFVESGKMIKKHLEESLGKDILFFHGSLNLQKRKEMIAKFENDNNIPAMVLSLRAGGLGLNLTAANYVFHYDRWWNPAVENQAVDRVHRIGQTRNTFVYKFITKDTLEERIDELIESKIKLSDGIIPKGESIISELSEKEFMKLIKRI
ncbi:MAG: DEAD/DEAH box helicase [Candidatus Delongbacteria bacterium]|nr:DEAD/DEAH box helicase [Candidatus Delongbacteria bacterium]